MFGLSVGLPLAFIFARQRHFIAMPPSMQASLEPIADVPSVCERIRGALALLGDDSRADSPDKVFQRLGS